MTKRTSLRANSTTITSQSLAARQTASLLVLPAELFTEIVDNLSDDTAALGSLALVNTTLHLLVRPLQFQTIYVNTPPSLGGLLYNLIDNPGLFGIPRRRGAHLQHGDLPPLGHHIRHLIVKTDFYHEDEDCLDMQLADENASESHDTLRKAIEGGMPKLCTILWASIHLTDKLWSSVVKSGIRHLRLHNTSLEHGCWNAVITPGCMPLEMLSMSDCRVADGAEVDDLQSNGWTGSELGDYEADPRRLPDFIRSVLSGCAPTLRSLDLSTELDTLKGINLPKLAELRLDSHVVSPGIWSELSQSPLKFLDLAWGGSVDNLPGHDTWQLKRINLPANRTDEITETIAFLKQQSSIEYLGVLDYIISPDENTPASPDVHIVLLLSAGVFWSLTSLSLMWNQSRQQYKRKIGLTITDSALASI